MGGWRIDSTNRVFGYQAGRVSHWTKPGSILTTGAGGSNQGSKKNANPNTNTTSTTNRGVASSSGSVGPKIQGVRRLSQEEWADRQRKGLCFKCRERWSQDHIFKVKGTMKGQQVVVLLDPRASTSFIATKVVNRLGLPVQKL
ncbi:hypothetical protein PIB30_028176 [Stylosanthes scabra]|uniref:Uncharacterized protein n=1 Tax=Stylosanthes scabra TaxID=79078 RepID=A0ABU6QAF3_9FABA|nr:hypothetical protein [Stylosanthes scabra]